MIDWTYCSSSSLPRHPIHHHHHHHHAQKTPIHLNTLDMIVNDTSVVVVVVVVVWVAVGMPLLL
jgi:hypothetical protein